MKTPAKGMTRVLISGFAIGLATLCLLPLGTQAATNYWDFGANPDTLWSTLANWDTAAGGGGGDPVSVPPGAADTAIFNVSTLNSAQTITLGAPLSIGGLVFTNTGTTKIWAITTARVVTLGAGGITVNAGAGAVTFGGTSAPNKLSYILGGAQSWVNNSVNIVTFTFASTATLGIDNAGYLLTIDGSGDLSTTGTTSGPFSGSGGLTKNGTGTFFMGMNASTYSGVTTINAGILAANTLSNINMACSIGKGSAGGSAADLVFGGGTLKHETANVASSDRLFTIGNANGLTATLDSSATLAANTVSLTGAGSLAFGGSGARTLTLTGINTGTNTFRPVIGDGPGGGTALVKSGGGTWVLTGANTYAGGTTISAGTLKLNGSGTLGGGSGALTLSGGTLDLGGNNQSAGSVTASGGSIANGTLTASSCSIQTGMLQLDYSGAFSPRTNLLAVSPGLTLENGGGLIVKGAPGLGSTQSFANVTIGEGFSQIWIQPNGGTNTMLNLGGLATTAGGGLFITNGAGGVVTTTSANDDAGILSGRIVYKNSAWSGANFATRNDDGSLGANPNFITATTSFTPITGSNYTLIGHGTLLAGGTVNSLRLVPTTGNRVLSMSAYSLTITSGGVLLTADNDTWGFAINNGKLTVGSGNELIVNNYTTTPLLCNAQIIDNGSPVAVTLVGAYSPSSVAPLTLGTNNTYSGGTFINGGTLLTAAYPQSLGTGFVKLNGGKLLLATTLTISSNLVGTSGSVIDLGTNTLTVNQGGNSAFAGSIINTGALVKAGSGVLTLSRTNTYRGGTTVQAGTLLVNNTSGSGTGTNTVAVKNSATLGGTGSIAGTVTVENGGTLNAGSPGAAGTLTVSNLVLSASSTFAVNLAGATNYDRVVVTGSLTPAGALVVTPIGGYSPDSGTEWTIVTGSVSAGSFSPVTPGYEVVIGAGSVVLRRTGGNRGTVMLIR